MKVFTDTNFLVSAYISHGLSAEVFQLIIAEHELIVGEYVLKELQRVLTEKLKMPNSLAAEAENQLRNYTVAPVPENKSQIKVRDEDDRWVLESALQSEAEILITGDKDLLVLADEIDKIKILTPREFWELVQK